MKPLCDVCVVVPSENMQIIEDLHLSIAHSVFRALRHEIQETNQTATMTLADLAQGSLPLVETRAREIPTAPAGQ